MMCDECGIRPAQFHLTTISGEEKTERNLCPVCMAKYQKQIPGLDFTNLAGHEALGIEIETTDGVIQKYTELHDNIEKVIAIKEAEAALDSGRESYGICF